MIYIMYDKFDIFIRSFGNYYNHENKQKIIKEKSIIIIIRFIKVNYEFSEATKSLVYYIESWILISIYQKKFFQLKLKEFSDKNNYFYEE